MQNVIIIIVIAAIAAAAIFHTVKHFKGKSGCCGGGGYTHKRKKLKNVTHTKTFRIEGMHCVNCKNRIEETVNDIDGIAGIVDLKNGELTVSYTRNVDDETITARIERAGYSVR